MVTLDIRMDFDGNEPDPTTRLIWVDVSWIDASNEASYTYRFGWEAADDDGGDFGTLDRNAYFYANQALCGAAATFDLVAWDSAGREVARGSESVTLPDCPAAAPLETVKVFDGGTRVLRPGDLFGTGTPFFVSLAQGEFAASHDYWQSDFCSRAPGPFIANPIPVETLSRDLVGRTFCSDLGDGLFAKFSFLDQFPVTEVKIRLAVWDHTP